MLNDPAMFLMTPHNNQFTSKPLIAKMNTYQDDDDGEVVADNNSYEGAKSQQNYPHNQDKTNSILHQEYNQHTRNAKTRQAPADTFSPTYELDDSSRYFQEYGGENIITSNKQNNDKKEEVETIPASDRDEIIYKLRTQNQNLTMKLMELHKVLDQAVEKSQMSTAAKKSNQLPPNIQDLLKVKDKEINQQENELQMLKKEAQSLRLQMDAHNDNGQAQEYEHQLKIAERKNQELYREIVALQKISSQQSKGLEKSSNEIEYINKYSDLREELKESKQRIRQIEDKRRIEQKTIKKQFETMMKLQDQCKQYQASQKSGQNERKLQKAQPVESQEDKDKMIEELQKQLEDVYQDITEIEKDKKRQEKINKMLKQSQQKEIDELTKMYDHASKDLREKDQEEKIANFKLKEINRSMVRESGHRTPMDLSPRRIESTGNQSALTQLQSQQQSQQQHLPKIRNISVKPPYRQDTSMSMPQTPGQYKLGSNHNQYFIQKRSRAQDTKSNQSYL